MEHFEGFPPPPWAPRVDRAVLRANLAEHLARWPVVLIGADRIPIEGSCGLWLLESPWGPDKVLCDRWTYLRPGRGLGGLRGLLAGARATARGLGLPLVLGNTSGRRTAALDAFFARAGGRYLGGAYLWA